MASKVVNALTRCAELDALGIEGILKRAVRGSGTTGSPNTFPSELNTADQNVVNLGHDQNMCM